MFETIMGAVVAGFAALFGYIFKTHARRLDNLEIESSKAKLEVQKKLSRSEVKEVIEDELKALYIYIKAIHKDIQELKESIKHVQR